MRDLRPDEFVAGLKKALVKPGFFLNAVKFMSIICGLIKSYSCHLLSNKSFIFFHFLNLEFHKSIEILYQNLEF